MEQSYSLDEIEVAKILLELPYIIYESARRRFTWGGKRKRSALTKEQFTVASLPAAVKLSPAVAAAAELPERQTEKILTSSPATPLSFSPSESDEKPPKKKASVNIIKRKKEQSLKMEDITRRSESLEKDIESKKLFLDRQKAHNVVRLEAKKEELSPSFPKANGTPLGSMGTENCQGHHHHQQIISTRVLQQPLIMGRTVCKSETKFNSENPYNGMTISWLHSNTGALRKVPENIGPLGYLDLNVSAEEVLWFGSPRSVDPIIAAKARAAAQARFNRMQKCRAKYHYNSKTRYASMPHR